MTGGGGRWAQRGGRVGVASAGATLAVVGAVVLAAPPSLAAQDPERGKAVYDRWCAGCHGETGAGDGEAAAYMLPRPRDFTRAVYQIRTTASGGLPTDEDLRRVIDMGMPGTAMPAWEERLSRRQRDDVIAYIKTFSRFFEGASPEALEFGSPPRVSDEGLLEGRRLYDEELECLRCHGDAGRGDGTSAPDQTDDWDYPIRVADLTEPWNFNGGSSVEDIFHRMWTGLDGTPMPSFADVVDAEIVTREQLWRAAQYVRSLAPDATPRVRDVVRAALTEGSLPSGPDDPAWEEVERYYVPLVGQIIDAPRSFAPTVDGVWVQGVHDGNRLALRLTWHDPTRSPDPAWEVFFERYRAAMTDVDGGYGDAQGPDRFTIQFPLRPETGQQLPYFLGGDSRRPVYALHWASTPDQLEEGTMVGLGTFSPSQTRSDVTHDAVFDAGEWRLQFTRSLVSPDTAVAPSFVMGDPIPIGFYAADGTIGENDFRGAVSAWYAIYLDVPTPTRVYVAPVLATLLTATLGVVIVWRAQQRERES